MTNLTVTFSSLLFIQRNSTKVHMRQRILNSLFFSIQLKNEDRTNSKVIELKLKPSENVLPTSKRTAL